MLLYGVFILIIWFLRDVTILTVRVDKQNSRNARMKRRNILAQKSMKNKQKVSSTSNGGESENCSQLSTLEFNISKKNVRYDRFNPRHIHYLFVYCAIRNVK